MFKLRYIFIFLFGILSILALSIFLFAKPSGKTWAITFGFNSENKELSFKSLEVLDLVIDPDYRASQNSPYELSVLDKGGKVLYLNKIHITEELTHSIWTGYTIATPGSEIKPSVLETTVFIPYFDNASKIQIERDGKVILTIDLKQKSGYLWIPEVFAQRGSSASGPIKAVIIGEGFSSSVQFQQYAVALIGALRGVAPYSEANPPIIEYINADTQINLGCAFAPGPFQGNCTEVNIKRAGYVASSRAAKFIVLVNNNLSMAPALNLTNDIGGDISFVSVNQPQGVTFTQQAIHEFLGHAVGELYDRYALTSKPGIKYGIRSNCSDNPAGEAFWRTAGANGPYPQPCDSPNLYAPTANDCPPPPQPPPGYTGPIILTRGSSSTIMGGCSNPNAGFDNVEQAWIRTQIIPRYQSPLPTPLPTPTSTPTGFSPQEDLTIVVVDSNGQPFPLDARGVYQPAGSSVKFRLNHY